MQVSKGFLENGWSIREQLVPQDVSVELFKILSHLGCWDCDLYLDLIWEFFCLVINQSPNADNFSWGCDLNAVFNYFSPVFHVDSNNSVVRDEDCKGRCSLV